MAGDCRRVVFGLLSLQTLAGVMGQGMVSWQYGMFGVTEGQDSVEVCAEYSGAVEGFAVETSTTEVVATNGTDYISQIGTAAQLIWPLNSTIACISIPIIDDKTVENDEVFIVNMVRIVSSPSSASPDLDVLTIVMIMDNDLVPVVFTSEGATVTDDLGSVEVCVAVDDELVTDSVAYRIPIAVETEGGTAEPGVDFESFNNMTAGEKSRAVLTPFTPSHCFSISLLTRQDNRLDDRSFFVGVSLRNATAVTVPAAEQIQLPPSDFEVVIQPAAQIEVGAIMDSILSNPLFSVSLDMKGAETDSHLCYEVHGESGMYLNFVSDACFSINAHYDVIDGAPFYNRIDQVFVAASDAAGGCSNILIDAAQSCTTASLSSGKEQRDLSERYRRNGLQIEFLDGSVEVLLPCQRYPGGGIKVVVVCNQDYLYRTSSSEEILPVKNLNVLFYRAKLPSSTYPMPHGLVGQFWHLEFAQEPFTEAFIDGRPREGAMKMTTPAELGAQSFVGLQFPVTWDQRYEGCLYAGTRQAGTTPYVTSPAGSVIEGDYRAYSLESGFDSDYEFSVFSRSEFDCPYTQV
jgi:hypothetical protein